MTRLLATMSTTSVVTLGLGVVLLAMPAALHAQVEDLTPPTIASVSFSPGTLNVGAGAQNVTVTEHLTDDLAGVSFSCFGLISPSAQQTRNGCNSDPYNRDSGTSLDGIYKTDITFPQFSETGEWRISYLYVCDFVSNCRYTSQEGLAAFPTVQIIATPDATPPAVASFEVSPGSIDVSTSGQAVTVTARMIDDAAGVSFSCFGFISPSSQQMRNGCNSDPYNRHSGNNRDGIYHTAITYPQFSEMGEWKLHYLYACDVVGNCRYYSQAELEAFATVQVVSNPDDTTRPSIASFTLAPTSINTSTGAQTVTASERLTDDLAGVSFSCFGLISPSSQQTRNGCNSDPYNRHSGSPLDGTYSTDITFPQFSETGEWHVSYLYACDVVGNCRYLSQEELAALPTLRVVVNEPPDASAGSDQIVEGAGPAGTQVTLDGSGSSDPDGDPLTYTWREDGDIIAGPTNSPAALVTLALGSHTIELTVEDGNGATDNDQVVITVVDTTPPILQVSLSSDTLWPPNHQLVEISASIQLTDDYDANPTIEIVSVTSSEPDNGLGDGDMTGDIQDATLGSDDRAFRLRAERSGAGGGRIYTVTYRATDSSGNTTTVVTTVTVAKSMGKSSQLAH